MQPIDVPLNEDLEDATVADALIPHDRSNFSIELARPHGLVRSLHNPHQLTGGSLEGTHCRPSLLHAYVVLDLIAPRWRHSKGMTQIPSME